MALTIGLIAAIQALALADAAQFAASTPDDTPVDRTAVERWKTHATSGKHEVPELKAGPSEADAESWRQCYVDAFRAKVAQLRGDQVARASASVHGAAPVGADVPPTATAGEPAPPPHAPDTVPATERKGQTNRPPHK